MKKELSILIPTYNDFCGELVSQLAAQARQIEGLNYEIIVADDGSTDAEVVKANQELSALECCKVYRYETNRGRAAIRNSLVEFANYEWLLFIDSGDMRLCSDDYLLKYLTTNDSWLVVYGGYCLAEMSGEKKKGNLRYKYELKNKQNASALLRCKAKRPNFQSCNFMAHKDIFRQVQFDERFVNYGYEDVLLGKELRLEGVEIYHIDNLIERYAYVDNPTFLRKTTVALSTLKKFESELRDCSRLIQTSKRLRSFGLAPLVRCLYKWNKERWRANLEGSNPSTLIFNLYRLGFYLDL